MYDFAKLIMSTVINGYEPKKLCVVRLHWQCYKLFTQYHLCMYLE